MSFAALVRKDLRVEWRNRDAFAAGLTVALLVALVGNIAFAGRAESERAVAGVVWIAVMFSAQVALARAFVVERDRGTLDAMLASPATPFQIWASKALVHAGVLIVLATFTHLAAATFFRLERVTPTPAAALILVLGVAGIALVTTTSAALAAHGTNWVLLVPLLSLPLLFPVAAAAVSGTDLALQGASMLQLADHLRVLAAFDVVMLTAAWLLVPFVLEP